MPRHRSIDRYTLEAALVGLEQQKAAIDSKLKEIRRMLRTAGAAPLPVPKRRRRISAAARKRMSEASKKRWAEFRHQQPA